MIKYSKKFSSPKGLFYLSLFHFLLTYQVQNDKMAYRKQFLLSKKPRKGNDKI